MCDLNQGVRIGTNVTIWISSGLPPMATLDLTSNEQFNWTACGVLHGGSTLQDGQWKNTVDIGLLATQSGGGIAWVSVDKMQSGQFVNPNYNFWGPF
jgi:hypothetical protein